MIRREDSFKKIMDVAHEKSLEREKTLEQIAKEQTIVFFLGAGASVEAGVPTTVQFVEEFESRLNEEPNRSKLRGIFIGSLTIAIE